MPTRSSWSADELPVPPSCVGALSNGSDLLSCNGGSCIELAVPGSEVARRAYVPEPSHPMAWRRAGSLERSQTTSGSRCGRYGKQLTLAPGRPRRRTGRRDQEDRPLTVAEGHPGNSRWWAPVTRPGRASHSSPWAASAEVRARAHRARLKRQRAADPDQGDVASARDLLNGSAPWRTRPAPEIGSCRWSPSTS